MRYILGFILSMLCSISVQAQFYNDIDEVQKYRAKLSRLDIYLQTSPDNLGEYYDELFDIAKKDKNKTLEAVLHIYQGTGYYYSGQPDKAVDYFDKAIAIAQKLKNQNLLSTARIRRIFIIGESSDNKIAYQLMKDEYEVAKRNKDTLNMIYGLNGMNLFGEDNKKDSGVQATLKAIELAKDSGNEYEYGFLLNNLAVTRIDLGDSEGAYKDLKKALEIAKRAENVRLELTALENRGYYFMEVDSLDKAKNQFTEVYERASEVKHYQLALTSMVNLGGLYRRQGDNKKSDSLIAKSLIMAKETNMYYMVSIIYLNKAQLQLSLNNYNEVVRILDSVQYYSRFTPNNDVEMGRIQMNYLMYKRKGDFETALEYYQKLKKFQDSLDRDGRLQMVEELKLKYDVERKEKERVEQKNAYEKELSIQALNSAKLRQNIAIGVIMFVVILAGLIIYYFRTRHKRESEFSQALVNRLEEERGRIARDLHDGLGQSLVILKNKFNKMDGAPSPKSEEINRNFTETIEEVRSISRSLIPPELRRLGLRKSLNKMLKDIEKSSGIVVTTDIDPIDDLQLDQADEIRLYRIVQELSNNTIKHANATSLKLEWSTSGHTSTIIYRDNGVGMDPEAFEKDADSVGLRSIHQRLKYLNGSVKFEKPSRGFKAVIRIKHDQ